MNRYYRILRLSPGASKEQVKQAYRRRAKELHPDRNKAANAHDQFILLNEAYAYLMDPPARQQSRTTTTRSAAPPPASGGRAFDDWLRQRGTDAREQAKAYANMRYGEFQKTDFYKREMAHEALVDWLQVLVSACLVLVGVIIPFLDPNFPGIAAGVVFLGITSPFWYNTLFVNRTNHSIGDLRVAINQLGIAKRIPIIGLVIFNLYTFFSVTFITAVSHFTVVVLLLGVGLLAWVATSRKEGRWVRIRNAMLAISIVNGVFLLNNLVTSNSEVTLHKYSRSVLTVNGKEPGFTLNLENNAYASAPGVRFLLPQRNENTYNYLELTMATGLLGWQVKQDQRKCHLKRDGTFHCMEIQ